jgi:hypothetical protein
MATAAADRLCIDSFRSTATPERVSPKSRDEGAMARWGGIRTTRASPQEAAQRTRTIALRVALTLAGLSPLPQQGGDRSSANLPKQRTFRGRGTC